MTGWLRCCLNRLSLGRLTFLALALLLLLVFFISSTYVFDCFVYKVVFAIAAIVFLFAFMLVFSVALSRTTIAKMKVSVSIAFFLQIGILLLSSYLIGTTEVLLLLPLLLVLLYWTYIVENFVEVPSNRNSEIRTHIQSLRSYIDRLKSFTFALVGVLTILAVLLIRGILPVPSTFEGLYTVSLAIYGVIFSVVTAFGILVLGRSETDAHNTALRRPLLGLAHMCLAFILVSLVGTILGVGVEGSLFATGASLGHAFSWDTLGLGVVRVMFIQTVIISFPVTLLYLYAILRAFLLRQADD